MSTLLRWFSPAYRYALQAEAEGRYVDAARAYALCGQRLKVAEMHLLAAEQRGATASTLRELQLASHFADEPSEASRTLRQRLGQLYLRVLQNSVRGPVERQLCSEAAALLLAAGDAASAAQAYELGGDLEQAASAYEQAGDIDKVEALHAAAAQKRQGEQAERQALDTYQTQLELGQRRAALATLHAHSLVAADPRAAQQLLGQLAARQLPPGRVLLRQLRRSPSHPIPATSGSSETLYLGRFPLPLGRAGGDDALPPLLDPGLSRDHAQIELGESPTGPQFLLRDLGSKNGTTLGGLPVAGLLPLRGDGEIGLGQHVGLRFAISAERLELTVQRGRAKGLRLVASPQPIELTDGLILHFSHQDGQPSLSLSPTHDGELLLNGKRAPRQIQLLHQDVVDLFDLRIEVG